jgi:hypothetical protein
LRGIKVPSFLNFGHKNARELIFPGADGTILKDDRLAPSAGMIAALCVGSTRGGFFLIWLKNIRFVL